MTGSTKPEAADHQGPPKTRTTLCVLTAARALTLAAPTEAHDRLAASVGVPPGALSLWQTIEERAAEDSDNHVRVRRIPNTSEAGTTATVSTSNRPFAAKNASFCPER
jgi:hypothetical protein